MNNIAITIAALASVMATNAASAATLLVSLGQPAGNGTFIVDSNPVLLGFTPDTFYAVIRNGTGQFTSQTNVSFFASSNGGGFGRFFGPQLFSGSTASPTILTGTFAGSSAISGTVTISDVAAAVPEPTTWAMMMVGFGMIGAAARYRRRSAQVRYA